jgi:hypothetical protein
MTDDGKQKTEKVTLLRRCLASPSSGKPDALPLYDVKFSENGDQADRPKHPLSRRSSLTPSHTALARNRDLQTYIFHRSVASATT